MARITCWKTCLDGTVVDGTAERSDDGRLVSDFRDLDGEPFVLASGESFTFEPLTIGGNR